MADNAPKKKSKIRVEIEKDLKELIPQYLSNRDKDIQSIRQALEKKDFATIKSLGHQMKGSGGGYGFTGISTIGKHLEQAGQDNDAKAALLHLEELADYVQRLDIVYV
jgi:HPt (histidine-containing phosphotransfer) domain-containing protein